MASGHYKIHNGVEYLHIKCLRVFLYFVVFIFIREWLFQLLRPIDSTRECNNDSVVIVVNIQMSFSMFPGHDLLTYQLIQFLSTLLNLPISGAGTSQLFYCAFERLVFKVKANKTTVQPKGGCCNISRQEVSRCCTKGESEESFADRSWSMQASGSILVRNPGQTLLVFSNRGISGLRKMADVLQFFFKKTGGGKERIPSMS